MGYHFGPKGLAIAQKTLYNFAERTIRLYEREPGGPCGSTRLGEYVKRWVRWAGAGLGKSMHRDEFIIRHHRTTHRTAQRTKAGADYRA